VWWQRKREVARVRGAAVAPRVRRLTAEQLGIGRWWAVGEGRVCVPVCCRRETRVPRAR